MTPCIGRDDQLALQRVQDGVGAAGGVQFAVQIEGAADDARLVGQAGHGAVQACAVHHRDEEEVQPRTVDADASDEVHAAEARQIDQHGGACFAELGRRPQRGDAEAVEGELIRVQPQASLQRGRPVPARTAGGDAVGRPVDLVPVERLGRHVQIEGRFPVDERERAPDRQVVVPGAHARGLHAHQGAGPRRRTPRSRRRAGGRRRPGAALPEGPIRR